VDYTGANVKTGELALACPFCDAEQPPQKRKCEHLRPPTGNKPRAEPAVRMWNNILSDSIPAAQ
jgi:hypothetical protein